MREPKNQMLGTMEPPPLMQLSVKIRDGYVRPQWPPFSNLLSLNEPLFIFHILLSPNDPLFKMLSHLMTLRNDLILRNKSALTEWPHCLKINALTE